MSKARPRPLRLEADVRTANDPRKRGFAKHGRRRGKPPSEAKCQRLGRSRVCEAWLAAPALGLRSAPTLLGQPKGTLRATSPWSLQQTVPPAGWEMSNQFPGASAQHACPGLLDLPSEDTARAPALHSRPLPTHIEFGCL